MDHVAPKPYFSLSRTGRPELLLCVTGPILLVSLFLLPWFETSGLGEIAGQTGSVTGWEAYPSALKYFLLWCGVGSFLLPWIVARGHQLSWPPGMLTMIHGVFGFGVLFFYGLGYKPGDPDAAISIAPGYVVGLLTMLTIIVAGQWRAHIAAPPTRTPPGV
jgi:hypothetical protein